MGKRARIGLEAVRMARSWLAALAFGVPGTAAQAPADSQVVQAEMRNVDFHVDETIILRIGYLRGQLVPTKAGAPAILDDNHSFILAIDSARIRLSGQAIGDLLNRYVFDYRGAPLRGLRISVEGQELRTRGRMNGMPFSILSKVSVTPAGELRLQPVKIKAFGIPVTSIMGFLGLRLQKMLDLRKATGIRVEKNDLVISPTAIVPPPRIRGRLAGIELSDSTMVQIFRPLRGPVPAPLKLPDTSATNYMYFRSGSLRFGQLTMTPADLFIKDADPSNSFDVFLMHYNDQLVAGSSRNTATYGLITTMPDYRALRRKGAGTRD
jgi:hypothetical protein